MDFGFGRSRNQLLTGFSEAQIELGSRNAAQDSAMAAGASIVATRVPWCHETRTHKPSHHECMVSYTLHIKRHRTNAKRTSKYVYMSLFEPYIIGE